MAKCNQHNVYIKEGSFDISFTKENFGILVVLLDFVVILIFLYFIYFLYTRQEEYIEKFEMETIEMSDFTLEFSNLPDEGYYEGKLDVLRAKLWERLQLIMEEQYKFMITNDDDYTETPKATSFPSEGGRTHSS